MGDLTLLVLSTNSLTPLSSGNPVPKRCHDRFKSKPNREDLHEEQVPE